MSLFSIELGLLILRGLGAGTGEPGTVICAGSGEHTAGAEGKLGGETSWALTGSPCCCSAGAGCTGIGWTCTGSSFSCSDGAGSTGIGCVGKGWTGYLRDFNLIFAFGGVGRGVWVGAVLVIGVKLLRNLRFLSVTLPVPSTRTVYWS